MDAAPPVAVEVADRFGRFARDEAPGRSALYAEWAAGVAADAEVAAVLGRIPPTHRQPPLVFAVTRMLGAPEAGYPAWADWVRTHADALVAECSARSLQTNEPLRCAALLPALSGIDGPIALLEVGASAGLCLYPDRYSYRYRDGPDLDPPGGPSSVILDSALTGFGPRDDNRDARPRVNPTVSTRSWRLAGAPVLRMPDVVWRAGIDLAPLNAADADDRRFLTSLVWPGEQGRAARIHAALDVAAADPPLLVAGDATDQSVFEPLAAQAPRDATLVITTPGVLPHIPREGRARLMSHIAALDAVWISIDPPGLPLAGVAPVDEATWNGFVLRRDGVALAAVDPLGGFVEWRVHGVARQSLTDRALP